MRRIINKLVITVFYAMLIIQGLGQAAHAATDDEITIAQAQGVCGVLTRMVELQNDNTVPGFYTILMIVVEAEAARYGLAAVELASACASIQAPQPTFGY